MNLRFTLWDLRIVLLGISLLVLRIAIAILCQYFNNN
jgi:hypothetical protein